VGAALLVHLGRVKMVEIRFKVQIRLRHLVAAAGLTAALRHRVYQRQAQRLLELVAQVILDQAAVRLRLHQLMLETGQTAEEAEAAKILRVRF